MIGGYDLGSTIGLDDKSVWQNIYEKFLIRSFEITARDEINPDKKWVRDLNGNWNTVTDSQIYVPKFTCQPSDTYQSVEEAYLSSECYRKCSNQCETASENVYRNNVGFRKPTVERTVKRTVNEMNVVAQFLEKILSHRPIAFNMIASVTFPTSSNPESVLLLDFVMLALENSIYKIPKQLLHKTKALNPASSTTLISGSKL